MCFCGCGAPNIGSRLGVTLQRDPFGKEFANAEGENA